MTTHKPRRPSVFVHRRSVGWLAALLACAAACTGSSASDEGNPDRQDSLADRDPTPPPVKKTTSPAFSVRSTWSKETSNHDPNVVMGGSTTTDTIGDLCMGGIIQVGDKYRIVTAAHCFDKAKAFAAFLANHPETKLTIADFRDRSQVVTATEVGVDSPTDLDLGALIKHPDYDASQGNDPHDIAYAPVSSKLKAATVFRLADEADLASMTGETELSFYKQGYNVDPTLYRLFYNAAATKELTYDPSNPNNPHPIRLYDGTEALQGSSGGPIFSPDHKLYGSIIGTYNTGSSRYNSTTDVSDPTIASFLTK